MLFNRNFYPGPRAFAPRAVRELTQLLDNVLQTASPMYPAFCLSEEKEKFVLCAKLPGMDADDIKITVQGKTVYLEGQRKAAQLDDNARYHRQERYFGSFSRAITLPSEVDVSKVEAKQQDGVLRITLPKDEALMPRQIKVN